MNISEECFKEIIEMVEALIEEADHHANKKNPVVKITDKNYQVASGKSLPGPFNKNHVGQYIVYNKDTDASYLVTPDNWKKSKIKRDLERQGKFYEALEEAIGALLEYTEADKRKAAKKVVYPRKKEYLSKYSDALAADDAGLLDTALICGVNKAEKRYKHAKKEAGLQNVPDKDIKPNMEPLEEALNILSELFDRPDLLNDIDDTLGSPVKKTFKRAVNSIIAPKKYKANKIEEAMELMEEIINEVSVKRWVEAAGSSLKNKGTAYNDHAKAIYHNLPMSNRSANSVVRAATKSMKPRDKKYYDEENYEIPNDPYCDNPDPVPDEATDRNMDRCDTAYELAYANKKNFKKQIEANKKDK